MKLVNINRLDEALLLNRQYPIIEGLLSDLIANGISKFQTYIAGHNKVVEQLGLLNYIKAAKELNTSLLDDSSEADDWWQSAISAIDKKHGGRATKKERAMLIAKAKAKIGPIINRDLENTKDRLAALYAQRTGNTDVDKLFEILFNKAGSTPTPRRRSNYAYESRDTYTCVEGIGQTISNALDMLDPKKRVYKGAELIRSGNNGRIATIAISILSQQLDAINTNRKQKTTNKKPPIPSTPLTKKYDMAMFINRCMRDASKQANQDKDEGYWIRRIRAKAKRMGMNIDLRRLPAKPYPKDFDEFREQYGPKPVLKPGQRA
jgi:hypothetical protein